MNCPNCGLANDPNARFCANCGTPLSAGGGTAYQQQPQSYPTPSPASSNPFAGNSMGKNIALGCLVFALIFLFLGLSCTRACFGGRHRRVVVHRRY